MKTPEEWLLYAINHELLTTN